MNIYKFLSLLISISLPYFCQAQEVDSISQNISLSEIVIKASPVRHTVNKDIYAVTDSMAAQSTNTLELLDMLQGIRYDRINNSIKIANKSNILFTIDGREQTSTYIMNLNPEQISRVEVIRTPKGKYASEGYDAVINVVMRKDFRGYNVNLSNFMLLNLSKNNNGKDWLMSEQPSINASYTNQRINIYGHYVNGVAHWNTPMERHVTYLDILSMASKPLNEIDGNDQYRYRGNVAAIGINVSLDQSRKHTLSVELGYQDSRIKNTDSYEYTIQNFQTNDSYKEKEIIQNITDDASWSGLLFYNGTVNDKLKLYADLAYDYFNNDVSNLFSTETAHSTNIYKEGRKLLKYSFDTEYTLSDKFSLTSGLAGNYRKYDSPNVDFNYKEYRQKLYAFAKYAPIDQLQTEFGLGGEYIKTKNTNLSQDYFHLLPLLQINYQPNENINLRTSYSTDMSYPSLSQLNPERMKIDNLMYQQGNTSLKSSLSHSVKVDLNYKELFSIVSRYQYAPNYISDMISHSSDEYKITYENIDYQELAFEATSDIPLSRHWMLSLAGTYYLSYAKHRSIDYHTDGWYLDADICYFSDSFTAQFGYHKNMDKRNKLQGSQEYNFDSWTLMLNKQFFNNRLGLTFNYLLPLKWGTKEKQTRSITTPTYNEILYTGVKPYRSTLVLQLTYRFNSGKVRHQKHKSSVKREERIMRTFDF